MLWKSASICQKFSPIDKGAYAEVGSGFPLRMNFEMHFTKIIAMTKTPPKTHHISFSPAWQGKQ